MTSRDQNIEILETLATDLEPLLSDLILVGGCAVGLLITDKSQTPVRPTIDVDLVTEALTLPEYYQVCEQLKVLGFTEGDIACRYTKGSLIVDLMSPDERVLGFTNRWYGLAAEMSAVTELPSGKRIRHVTAPLLIATKLESFHGRGEGDYSHSDIDDIATLVDGRPDLLNEIHSSLPELRSFIRSEIDDFLADDAFVESLTGHLRPGDQNRLPILIERFRKIAGI